MQILSYLRPRDLISAAGVSKHWRGLCEDTRMWHNLCGQIQLPSTMESSEEPSLRFGGGWKEKPWMHRSFFVNIPDPYEQTQISAERATINGP